MSTKNNKNIPKTSPKGRQNLPKWAGFWWGNGEELAFQPEQSSQRASKKVSELDMTPKCFKKPPTRPPKCIRNDVRMILTI